MNKALFGTLRFACRTATPRPQTDVRLSTRQHAASDGPTWIASFLGGLPFRDLLIPEAVMSPRPGAGDFSTDNRGETSADHGRAQVNMNNKAADGRKCRCHVYRDGKITQPAQTPRDRFNKPQPKARNGQQDPAIKHQPEEQFLAVVKAADGRKILVFIPDVVLHRFRPASVSVGCAHVRPPLLVHPERRYGEGQAKPGMPEARSRSAADQSGQPEHIRRPEGEACKQAIDVGQPGNPVVDAFSKCVAENPIA